ncbi:hypothetical protein VTN00DRAFT_2960 [Thermoascus crustaceus]|uniref:uncharacterized protein n=1 Tax=Thermoascus crustaceus TaxID=5088 RepID=UPI003743E121
MTKDDWHSTAARRRDEIYSHIPREWLVDEFLLEESKKRPIDLPEKCGLLTPRELRITGLSAVELLRRIHDGIYTAVEVTRAFCKRAAIAHQATNCLAWVMFESALAQAAALDEYLFSYGKPIGPLHGLPISVKEHIYLAGTPATSGLIAWADEMSQEDALIVKLFREAGAVFHVKTTNPQTLMSLETQSNLYGRTLNPHNTDLSPGGSSGGEGALIAMRGSLLGIGTDIGGSIRVPSGFSGIYGLKPSVARLPHSGLSGLHAGMENIIGCVGPMATSIDDLKLFCRVALAYNPWDHEPTLVELPWKEDREIQSLLPDDKLRIGVIWHDGVVHPHPPITRALRDTVTALRRAGHTVIDWDTTLHASLIDTVNKAYFLDGGREYRSMLLKGHNEPAVPLLDWTLTHIGSKPHTIEESWTVNLARDKLRTLYAKQLREAEIDVLLSPVHPAAASAHNESRYWGYCSVFNALDFSAAVFPAGTVQETDTWDRYPRPTPEPFSEMDKWYESLYVDGEAGPEKYAHAPIPLQLVGRRFQEEKLLNIMDKVVEILRAAEDYVGIDDGIDGASRIGGDGDEEELDSVIHGGDGDDDDNESMLSKRFL